MKPRYKIVVGLLASKKKEKNNKGLLNKGFPIDR